MEDKRKLLIAFLMMGAIDIYANSFDFILDADPNTKVDTHLEALKEVLKAVKELREADAKYVKQLKTMAPKGQMSERECYDKIKTGIANVRADQEVDLDLIKNRLKNCTSLYQVYYVLKGFKIIRI